MGITYYLVGKTLLNWALVLLSNKIHCVGYKLMNNADRELKINIDETLDVVTTLCGVECELDWVSQTI